MAVRDARAEATARLPAGYEARVLEPSPPAVDDGIWFADDPTDPAGAVGVVVSPVSDGDVGWDDFVRGRLDLASFAADHWLGAWHRLGALPEAFAATRDALHVLAYFVLSPARHRANGRMGLRFTLHGFGTPFFGDDEQLRVEGSRLIHHRGDVTGESPITTAADACRLAGIEYRPDWFEGFRDPLPAVDPEARLPVDAGSSHALGAWFGFGTSVLEELRRVATPADEVSRVQLWPEHFDMAVELGRETAGARASYGASPGDLAHPEPYLYVSAWGDVDRDDPYWDAETFTGSILAYRELLDVPDQRRRALDFFLAAHRRLTGGGT